MQAAVELQRKYKQILWYTVFLGVYMLILYLQASAYPTGDIISTMRKAFTPGVAFLFFGLTGSVVPLSLLSPFISMVFTFLHMHFGRMYKLLPSGAMLEIDRLKANNRPLEIDKNPIPITPCCREANVRPLLMEGSSRHDAQNDK
jgi:hypothetical protein